MKKLVYLMLFTLLSCNTMENEEKVGIYPDEIISSNFIGNGVQWSAYHHANSESSDWGKLMTDEKWQMNFDRLDYMKPKLFRILDQANWRYLVGFDEFDEPILDFNTDEVKALEKLLDYAEENEITVLFGEWGTPYKMHDKEEGHGDKFTGANDPKWIKIIVQYLDYLINTRGYTCLKYYNHVNEPDGFWASTDGNFEEWSEGVKLLKAEMDRVGLSDKIVIAGPDAVWQLDWVKRSLEEVDHCLGIYDVHAYAPYDLVRSGEFQQVYGELARPVLENNKQIFFGEIGFNRKGEENQKRAVDDGYASEDSQMDVYDFSYGIDMADVAIQIQNAGYSGSAAWDLDDAMHTKNDLGQKNQLKRWGMWNSLGTEICNNPEDENMRPWFYSWSLLCRYFPPGYNIIATDSTGIDGLRLSAGANEKDMTIAIVNNSETNNEISLHIPETVKKHFKKYLYTEEGRLMDENGFPVPAETQIKGKELSTIEIPANSFVLLTTIEY
jgi:hypothetical protein